MSSPLVFVTGSSGFVGTNFVQYLLERGCTVISLDQCSPRWTGKGYCCTTSLAAKETDYDWLDLRGDVRDEELLKSIFYHPVEYVIHLAARSTIQMGAEDCAETMSVNVGGTETLLRAATDCATLKGFLYASTDKVYGLLQGQAYTETDALAPLDSPYDRSKAAAEQFVRICSQNGKIPGVILRFCNLYGPYDLLTTRIVPRNIRAVLENRLCTLRVYRDRDNVVRDFRREFLYIGDLCETIWKIIEKLENQETRFLMWGEAFNLGSQSCYPISEVIRTIQSLLGVSGSLEIEELEGLVEIPEQRMDSSKARGVFDFSPKTSLEDGLATTIKWWQQYLDAIKTQNVSD